MSGKSTLKILIAHKFVMGGRMVLGKIIGTIGCAGRPVQIELPAGNAVSEPMIAHVKSLRLFHANLRVENTVSGSIVGFKWSTSSRLFVTHFFQSSKHRHGFLGIEEEAASFGFGGGGGNSANGFAQDMNSTVELGVGRRAGGAG